MLTGTFPPTNGHPVTTLLFGVVDGWVGYKIYELCSIEWLKQ